METPEAQRGEEEKPTKSVAIEYFSVCPFSCACEESYMRYKKQTRT